MPKSQSGGAAGLGLVAVLLGLVCLVGSAGAYGPVGSQFKVSNALPNGTNDVDATSPSVAYNATATEYLVVWAVATAEAHPELGDLSEIYGRRIDADGTPLGNEFRISQAGPDHPHSDADDYSVFGPEVAWNPGADEYLVSWSQAVEDLDDSGNGAPVSVMGRIVSGAGTPSGTPFTISTPGAFGNPRFNPTVTAATSPSRYLVTWQNKNDTGGGEQIFARTVAAGNGSLGAPTQVSTLYDNPGAGDAEAVWNSVVNEFLVAWTQNLPDDSLDPEFEIYGQRLTAAGAEVGTDDFRISTTGTDGDPTRDASSPIVGFDPTPAGAPTYLVAWSASGGTAAANGLFGQRLTAAGGDLGGDFKISAFAGYSDLEYSSAADEYYVTGSLQGRLPEPGEVEVFGARMTTAGAPIGGELRLSTIGDDGSASREGLEPDASYNPALDEMLVVFFGDNEPTLNEDEVYARRLDLGAVSTLTVEANGTGTGTVTSTPTGISCPPTCSAPFPSGTQVRLTQQPDPGSNAQGFESCDFRESFTGPCWMNVESNKTAVSFFGGSGAPQRTLTVTVNGPGAVTGSGIACPGDCSHAYPQGTAVVLAASPGPGAAFSGWGGSCSGKGSCTITMDGDRAASAGFSATSVDTHPPQTRITAAPPGRLRLRRAQAKATVTFRFVSSEPGSSFQCKLDKGKFASCRSPRVYRLGPGSHTFQVGARDAAGNADPSPARRSFQIKRAPRRG